MRLKRVWSALCIALCAATIAGAQNKVVTYPIPEGVEQKHDFTVRVRAVESDEWQDVETYAVKVDEVRGTKHYVEKASLAYFDFEGEVEVAVTFRKGAIETGRVRPLSYGIVPVQSDSTLSFRMDRPRNLSVEVNGDIFHNLHLFAGAIDEHDPLKEVAPKQRARALKRLKRNKDLIYFAPGVHQLPGDTLDIPSGKTVYLAGGAVVKGCLRVKNAHDVKILGRGRVHPDGRGAGIEIINSRRVLVDGPISTQCPTGGSDSVTIRNVKVISSYGWGDGLNVFASNNVLFDGVFCRTSDDCTTVYGTRKGFVGGCRNITMQHATLWADVAHPIFIGIHGNVENPEVLENLSYVDIDILDHKEKQLDYQGCLAINAGDENLIRKVRFENIRIEDFRQGQLVNLRIFYNKKYCKAPGRGIEDILFKDITYTGNSGEVSQIIGYTPDRMVRNIRFENLVINGERISDTMPGKPAWYKTGDMARIFVGEHTQNVTFE